MGSDGIGMDFMAWSGLKYANRRYLQPGAVDTFNQITDNSAGKTQTVKDTLVNGAMSDTYVWWMQDINAVFTGTMHTDAFDASYKKMVNEALSMSFFHAIYPGSCAGGFELDTWTADAGEVDGTSLNELVEDAIKAYTPETMWNGKRIFKRGGEFDWNHVFDFCDALKTENAKTTSWSNSIWTEYNTTALNRNNYKLGVDTNGNVTVQTDWKDCAANGNDKHTSGRGCLDNFITIMNGLCQQANAFDLTSSSATFPRFEIGKGTDVGMFDKGLALKEMNAWASYIEKDPDGPHRQKTNDDATVTLKGNAQKPEFIVSFQGTKSTDSSMVHYSLMNDPVYTCLGSVCNIVMDGYFQYMNGLKGCLDDFVDNHKVLANSADGSFDGNTKVHAHTTFITGHSLGGAAATIYAQTRPLHSWQPKNDGSYESSFTGSVDAKLFPRLVVFGTPPTGYKGFKAIHPDNMIEDQGYSNALGNTIKCVYPTGQGHMKHAPLPTSPSSTDDFGYEYGICSGTMNMNADPFNDDYGLYMTESGFGTYQSTHGGSSGYCGRAMKQSVGFMHKFDPIPST